MKKILVLVNFVDKFQNMIDEALSKKMIDEVIKTDIDNFNKDTDKILENNDRPIFMKGLIETSDFMRLILKHGKLYDKSKLLSHCGVFDDRFILTDGALNINPSREEKVKIIENALFLFNKLHKDEKAKVSILTPSGKYNPKIQSSVDGVYVMEELEDKADFVFDQLDTAISIKAAEIKGKTLDKESNILLCHDLDSGNILYKSFTQFCGYLVAGLIIGAKFPICLTSRSDSTESKLKSLSYAIKTLD